MVLPDPRDGALYAALGHGHFGVKLHRSETAARPGGDRRAGVPAQARGHRGQGSTARQAHRPGARSRSGRSRRAARRSPACSGAAPSPAGCSARAIAARAGSSCDRLWDPQRKEWFGGGDDYPASTRSASTRATRPRAGRRLLRRRLGDATTAARAWTCRADGMCAEYMPPERQDDPGHPGSAPHGAVPRAAGHALGPAPQRRLPLHRRRALLAGDHERAALGLRLRRGRAPARPRHRLVRAGRQGRAARPGRRQGRGRAAPATAARASRCCATACRRSTPTTSSTATGSTSTTAATAWLIGIDHRRAVGERGPGRQLAARLGAPAADLRDPLRELEHRPRSVPGRPLVNQL